MIPEWQRQISEPRGSYLSRLSGALAEHHPVPRGAGKRCAACGTRRTRVAVMGLLRLARPGEEEARTVQLDSKSRTFCAPCSVVLYRQLIAIVEAFPEDPPSGGG